MDKELIEKLENTVNKLEQLKGETITIKEYLTTDRSSYDRHFTSSCQFCLQVEHCGLRFSGARLMIEGFDENRGIVFDEDTGIKIVKPSAYYEVSIDNLNDIRFDNDKITLIERLSEKWTRKTEIILANHKGFTVTPS